MPHYIRRDLRVEAWQLNATDWDSCRHIAQWASALLLPYDDFHAFLDGIVLYINDEYAHDGDWIIRDTAGYHHVMTDTNFHQLFETKDAT